MEIDDLIIDLPDPTTTQQRRLHEHTPARIGIGRAGPRPRTTDLLLFQADHGVTQDALMREVDPDLLLEMGLFQVNSRASSRQEYLKRPDLGRLLTTEALQTLADRLVKQPDVQLFVSDGLSAAAVEHNLPVLLPALQLTLHQAGLTVGTPFFVRNGRVGLLNAVNQVAAANVCAVLIGERPGLARAESMSIYLGFRPTPSATDAQRNVISNIYEGGLPPPEAARQAVRLIQKMIAQQTSGVDLA